LNIRRFNLVRFILSKVGNDVGVKITSDSVDGVLRADPRFEVAKPDFS
jgi:hypothetical protein